LNIQDGVLAVDGDRERIRQFVGVKLGGINHRFREPEHQLPGAPIGDVEHHVKVLGQYLFRLTAKITVVVDENVSMWSQLRPTG
jgi:hypothetical protein